MTLRLLIAAGKASPAAPVGPALGQKGLNIMDFCKQFNARTAEFLPDIPLPVVVLPNKDRTFTFQVKSPTTTYLFKKCSGVETGSAKKGEMVGEISIQQIYEIAKLKQKDENLKHLGLPEITKTLASVARGMGLSIVKQNYVAKGN